MKLFFLLLVLLYSVSALSQFKLRDYSKPDNKSVYIDVIPLQKKNGFDSLQTKIMLSQKVNSNLLGNNLLFTLPNNSKVYILPQDNMPCLVPDMSQFNMPNTLVGKKITGMPPGTAPRQRILPDLKE